MPNLKIYSRRTIAYLAAVGLLIFLHFIGITKPAEGILIRISRPVMEVFYSGGSNIRNLYGNQIDKIDYNLAIDKLEQENKKLIAENSRLVALEEENKYLKEQIDFRESNNYNYLLAEIISRNDLMNNSSEEKSIVINKGTKDGIQSGLVLLDSEGTVIGKIIEARENDSRACLTVDKKCKFAAVVQNGDKTSGIVEGVLGLTLKMDLIPQTEELSAGSIIVTSGLENNIPRGLVIGRITEVIKENNNLWQTAVLEPLIDYEELVLVSVIVSE